MWEVDVIFKYFLIFFMFVIVFNEELCEEVYKICYNVYCEELVFEFVREDGKEIDDFDVWF